MFAGGWKINFTKNRQTKETTTNKNRRIKGVHQ